MLVLQICAISSIPLSVELMIFSEPWMIRVVHDHTTRRVSIKMERVVKAGVNSNFSLSIDPKIMTENQKFGAIRKWDVNSQ